jgi:hypothetical protein
MTDPRYARASEPARPAGPISAELGQPAPLHEWRVACGDCGGPLERYRGQGGGQAFDFTGYTLWCPRCRAIPFAVAFTPPGPGRDLEPGGRG